MKNEKSCGAVVLRRKNDEYEFLVIRQNLGHWCFPKGHVEGDETEAETALREVFEECGVHISIRDGFRVTTSYFPKDDVKKEVVYFLADYESGKVTLQEEEIMEYEWCDSVKASALITYDNDRNILFKAIEYLKDNDEFMQE